MSSKLDYEKLRRQERVWKNPPAPISTINKKRRKRRGRKKVSKSNKVLIRSQFMGLCAICKFSYFKDEPVWWDRSKPAGQKVAHKKCWSPS